MGTAKRERQKANRQLKMAQEAKQARRNVSKKWLVRLLIGVPLAVLAVVLLAQPWSDDGTPSTPTAPTVLDSTTVPALDSTTVPATDTTVGATSTSAPATTVAATG